MIRIVFFILTILWSTQLIMAYQFIVEANPKPSIEINIGAIYKFQEDILDSKNPKTHPIKKKEPVKVIKSPKKIVNNVTKKASISHKTLDFAKDTTKEDKAKKDVLIRNEAELKKKQDMKRLVDITTKEKILKEKHIERKKDKEITPAPKKEVSAFTIAKSSRAKNLLQRVEKSLLKNRLKTKEYPVGSEVKQANLLNPRKITQKSLKPVLASNNFLPDHIQKFVIPFSGANTDISSSMNDDLNKIVSFLNSNKNKRMRIVGHSSDKNKDIAMKRRNALERVVAVRKYLVDRGVNTRQISLQAAGNSKADKSNSDRVEIVEIK